MNWHFLNPIPWKPNLLPLWTKSHWTLHSQTPPLLPRPNMSMPSIFWYPSTISLCSGASIIEMGSRDKPESWSHRHDHLESSKSHLPSRTGCPSSCHSGWPSNCNKLQPDAWMLRRRRRPALPVPYLQLSIRVLLRLPDPAKLYADRWRLHRRVPRQGGHRRRRDRLDRSPVRPPGEPGRAALRAQLRADLQERHPPR